MRNYADTRRNQNIRRMEDNQKHKNRQQIKLINIQQ